MSGFGKKAGPTPSSSSQPRFGPPPSSFSSPPSQPRFGPPPSSFSSPPSPPPPRFAPRGFEAAPQAVRSPQFSYQSSAGLAPRGYQPAGIPRRPEGFAGVRSPPVPSESALPVGSPSYSSVRPNKWVNDQRSLFNDDAQTNSRRSSVTSFVASRSSGTSVTAKISRFQDLKRIRSPPLHSSDEGISRHQTSFQRPALAPRAKDSLPNLSENCSNLTAPQDAFPVSQYAGSHDSGKRFRNETVEVDAPKQSRSPPRPSATEVLQENTLFVQRRASGSPPRLGTRLNALSNASDLQMSQRPSPSVTGIGEVTLSRMVGFPVAKRTRSPPLPSIYKISQGNSDSTQDDAEREMQAKARRLARFKEELSNNLESESTPDVVDQKVETSRQEKPAMEFTNGNVSSDFEGIETSSAIIGLCPDMCPELERAERERKGDLDQYERLDGDRNQTKKFLAIKKYTRTAEREASLIRPMPILQKTVDYLLHLLDQPYDDRFLRMYNFLWDRMRAVRMDLRMQHIFNQEAITMLEQMIRLHVIAMHELCEYTKGEGFSEGFDAHLNIEQMNKTSVELFQMYDDHRKRGIDVPSEKEFRGYYALLKLDKHPGYKVEPAELSLDLAKMTPTIRQTPEVLFARDVARACRTSNFIVFFRLARKATYLQACLMHAHFAKLRTQALASLHSGVQSNQGIPIAQVAQWLAMEEEEIQSLLEYHGFVIREFEEPYMVKEGSFLNSDKDYPTKCSKLVHLKKLSRIVGDVSPTSSVVPLPTQAAKKQQLPKIYRHETKAAPAASVDKAEGVNDTAFVGKMNYVREVDEEMLDFRAASSPKVSTPMQSMEENSMVKQQHQDEPQVIDAYFSPRSFSSQQNFTKSQPVKFGILERQNLGSLHASPERRRALSLMDGVSSPRTSRASLQERLPSGKYGNSLVEGVSSPRTSRASSQETLPSGRYGNSLVEGVSSPRTPRESLQERLPSGIYGNTMENLNPQTVVFSSSEDEEAAITRVEENNVVENYNEEVARAKLKLIVRLWRRHSLRLKELRQQRHIAANAARNSLSLGPPIRQANDRPCTASEFDIDLVMRERDEKYEQSWSKLNVSDVIVDILGRRNPSTGFLCWKIVLCTQINNQGDKLEQRSKVTQVAAGSWLFSKLLPPRKDDGNSDDDLLNSCPGLGIWKQWVPNTSDNNLTCCMSVVRDVNFDDMNEATAGASAVLFLASESTPWNLQKAQLHNLLMSVPSGSSLPLLVLSDSYSKQDSSSASIIVSELGLNDVDESRISSFRVVFLVEDDQMEHLDGFFSDTQLREGIRWLASKSPLQPDLHCIKTRDLVLSHLSPAMQVLERLSDYEIRPNHCISAFNEALDSSLEKIDAAAKANPTGWPCPEIDLLEGLCDEHMVAKWHLPSTRWSSASSIEPLLCAVRDCKLPSFPDSMSWLGKFANTSSEIENLRSQLENCITKYLTQSSGMMGSLLAAKEAHVMLQRRARLELHDSSYYIVPKWVMLFRRIFNWRLTSLSSGTYSSAYVLRGNGVCPASEVRDELSYEEKGAFPYLNQPFLDEVIDAGCVPLLLHGGQPEPEAFQPPQTVVLNADICRASNANDLVLNGRASENSSNLTENERAIGTGKLFDGQNSEFTANGVDRTGLKVVSSVKEAGNNDKLDKLLEQCNIVQNSIEQKLFIYF